MDLTDFNCNYLNKLRENISKEQESVFLLGDFNVNLLNYNEHNHCCCSCFYLYSYYVIEKCIFFIIVVLVSEIKFLLYFVVGVQ